MKRVVFLSFSILLLATTAWAEPVLGVISGWGGSGKKIELTLKSGTDAQSVADAVSAVDGVKKAKVKAGKVLVIGLAKADLEKALDGVELGGDDIGALAAASLGDDDDGSGSSLRAKTRAKVNTMFKDRKTVAKGQVVSVTGGTFPKAVVKVRILSGPTGPLGKQIRKGKTIIFRPTLKMNGNAPDLSDEKTQINIGAWFLQAKDRVQVKIGKPAKGGYEAEVISR